MGWHKKTKNGRDWFEVYPFEFRTKVIKAIVEDGQVPDEVCEALGVGVTTVDKWLKKFDAGGYQALIPGKRGPKKKPKKSDAKRAAVVKAKQETPNIGTRRISDELRRHEGLGVSETMVRRILHEEGLLPARPPHLSPAAKPPRRFERAQPNQLWQSDIFSFLLRKHERLYVTVFMDDCSRFIVGHALAHHMKATLVMEALERGIASFGVPHEVLTDNGRQYTTWRGTTGFESELRRQGIVHIKSRPQHPQTLGKVERFWKTLWDEFLSRTVFADFEDCQRRLQLFIHGYNFQRPHQGIEGLVPADRYFGAGPQVRAAIEAAVQQNSLRLALQQPPRKPFYLAGQLGDRRLSIAAAGGELHVQMGDETPQTIRLPKEKMHESGGAETQTPPQDALSPDAPMAEFGAGSGRVGQAPLPAALAGALGRVVGDGRDRPGADFPPAVLPARREGAAGHAAGPVHHRAGNGGVAGAFAGERGGGFASASEEAGDGEAAGGPAALFDAQGGEARSADDWARAQEAGPSLDAGWADTFAGLDESDAVSNRQPFTTDADWRKDALTWERKLAGERADWGNRHEQVEVHEGTDTTAGTGSTLPEGAGGAVGQDDGDGRSEPAWLVSEPLPVRPQHWPHRPFGSAGPEAAWPESETTGGGAAGGQGATAGGGQSVSRGETGAGGQADGPDERADAWPERTRPPRRFDAAEREGDDE
jgi:transposase InsO family protein